MILWYIDIVQVVRAVTCHCLYHIKFAVVLKPDVVDSLASGVNTSCDGTFLDHLRHVAFELFDGKLSLLRNFIKTQRQVRRSQVFNLLLDQTLVHQLGHTEHLFALKGVKVRSEGFLHFGRRVCLPCVDQIAMPFVRALEECTAGSTDFLHPGAVLHALQALLLHTLIIFHLNVAHDRGTNSGCLRVERLAVHDQVEKRDALVGINMRLVNDGSWLGQDLSKALNGVYVALEAHVDHAAIVVVRGDLDSIRATQHHSNRMVDQGQGVLQALRFQAEQRILRVQGADLLGGLAEDANGASNHVNTKHGLLRLQKELCQVARHLLELVSEIFALLVQEVHFVDGLSHGHRVGELLRVLGVRGPEQNSEQLKIQISVFQWVDQLDRMVAVVNLQPRHRHVNKSFLFEGELVLHL